MKRPGQGVCESSLADSGNVLHEQVAACEQRDNSQTDRFGFPFDDSLDGPLQALDFLDRISDDQRRLSFYGFEASHS